MARQDPPRSGRRYRNFGWQGVSLTVPADWKLVFTEGDRQAGYVRLADDTSVRMELRWEGSPRDRRPPAVVDSYLEKLKKRARKRELDFSVQRELNLASPPGKEVECYRWVADRQSVAMASRCGECDRIVHVHLLGSPQEGLKSLARTTFASMQDHGQDGWERWEFLDMLLRSPAELPLVSQELKTGRIRMEFGRRLLRLRFVRLSLAEVLLAEKSLQDWLRGYYSDRLKRRSFEMEERRVKDHPGVRVQGRPWLLVNPLRPLGKARTVRVACWHCEKTNRLFICGFDGPESRLDWFEPAVEGFACCETSSQ
ncbi:MAG: hypothetical protein ACOC7T_02155 [Planctomycetota bacterium]